MACHCADGWICEEHPDQPWPHGNCTGPEAPCAAPDCPWWKGSAPAALGKSYWTNNRRRDEVSPGRDH